jgi:hypothetical protein
MIPPIVKDKNNNTIPIVGVFDDILNRLIPKNRIMIYVIRNEITEYLMACRLNIIIANSFGQRILDNMKIYDIWHGYYK